MLWIKAPRVIKGVMKPPEIAANELTPIITAMPHEILDVTSDGTKYGDLSTSPKHPMKTRNADAKNSAKKTVEYHKSFCETISKF